MTLYPIIVLAFSACTYQGSTPELGGPLTPAQYTLIDAAAEDWREQSDGKCCPAELGLAYQAVSQATCVRVGAPSTCGGFFARDEGLISLVTSRLQDGRLFRAVAQHEQGHACGLAHSDDMADLMYPVTTSWSRISAADIGAL